MAFPPDPDHGRPPKQIAAVMRLFDKPLHRDGFAWWTGVWALIAALSQIFPSEGVKPATAMPVWANAILSAALIGFLLGLVPAYFRLLARRRRFRRHAAANGVPAPTATGPQQRVTVASGPAAPQGHAEASRRTAASPPPEPPFERQDPPPDRSKGDAGASRAEPSRGATPISALDLAVLREEPTLQQARKVLPYPIARSIRGIQQSGDLKDAYENVLRAAETLSTVLGIVSTIWARQHQVRTPELDNLQKGFARGLTWGHWLDVVRSMDRVMATHPSALIGMPDALKLKKGNTGLEPDLRRPLKECNQWAHGAGPRNNLEASERLAEVVPPFLRAVEAAGFLADMPWLLVHDVKFRRREGDFLISASEAMGDHPDFEHRSLNSPTALAEDVFYLQTPEGALDLTPLVVMRPCPTCHQREVAFSDRLDGRQRVALKTFDRGHVLFDDTLADEVWTLVAPPPTVKADEAD